MSSRILRPAQIRTAEPLHWRNAGSTAHPARPGQLPVNGSPQRPDNAAPSGPSWEEYRAIETRMRDLEAQLPIREQAGRLSGQRDAEVAANARWHAALERATRSVSDVASFRGRLRREAEQDVIRLSMAMARRILRRELSTDPEALLGLVKTAMERLDLRETQRVRVRPEDAQIVTAFLEKAGCPARLEVVPDPTLERGGLLFETDRGQLDASADTQLQEIERGFADLLDRRRDS